MRATPTPQQNHLLAALDGDVRGNIFPHFEFVSMPLGKLLHKPVDVPIDSIVAPVVRGESSALIQCLSVSVRVMKVLLLLV